MPDSEQGHINIKVMGIGGAGGNAVLRMAKSNLTGVDFLALNTDVQALNQLKKITTLAIGPNTTNGMGSGGHHEIGRKAVKESQEQVTRLLEGADMVFITAGMGGGTGTGAASVAAEIAKRQGALTVGVVTLPFSFEGPQRRKIALHGLGQLKQKVDTLITIDNDRLLPSLKGKISLEKAFKSVDEVLRQGVQGISDIIKIPGLINVDFADVKSVMSGGGPSFMALGEGKGKWAAIEAAHMALSNPLFDAPLTGAKGILFNVKGGKDMTLGQVHEVAEIIRKASKADTNVIFGVVQDRSLHKRVSITLVATGLTNSQGNDEAYNAFEEDDAVREKELIRLLGKPATNGHGKLDALEARKLF